MAGKFGGNHERMCNVDTRMTRSGAVMGFCYLGSAISLLRVDIREQIDAIDRDCAWAVMGCTGQEVDYGHCSCCGTKVCGNCVQLQPHSRAPLQDQTHSQ